MTLPVVPDSFRWRDEPWGHALECEPLARIAAHVFTTRQLQLTEAGWRAAAAAVGAASGAVARVRQVHGNHVVTLDQPPATGTPEADAIVTATPSAAIAVVSADCVPVLMADARTGAVAAVHAGWRGTAASVVSRALQTLADEFGTRPEEVTAAIGPAIGPCCYEVGPELVDAFVSAGHDRTAVDRWFVALPPPRGVRGVARPPLRLDLPGANRDQLILAGVPETQIHVSGLCTAMHLDVLTSYRAERERANRLAAVIRCGR